MNPIQFKEAENCGRCGTHYHVVEKQGDNVILTHPHRPWKGATRRNMGDVVQGTLDVTRYYEKHFDRTNNWMGLCKMVLDHHDAFGIDYLSIDIPDSKIRGLLTVEQYRRLYKACGEIGWGGVHHRQYLGYETQAYVHRDVLWKFIQSGDVERTRAIWKRPSYIPLYDPIRFPLLNSYCDLFNNGAICRKEN